MFENTDSTAESDIAGMNTWFFLSLFSYVFELGFPKEKSGWARGNVAAKRVSLLYR